MRFMTVAALAASLLTSVTALASTIEVNYTGTVSYTAGTTANSGYADGASISGQFFINSATGVVSGSTLGTYAAPADIGVSSPSSLSSTDAIYIQGEYYSAGAPLNETISVDFSALTSYTGSDPAAFLLQSPATLASLIDFNGAGDPFASTATFYKADGAGNNVTDVTAYLTGLTAEVVPLPSAVWLMLSGGASLLAFARRRRTAG